MDPTALNLIWTLTEPAYVHPHSARTKRWAYSLSLLPQIFLSSRSLKSTSNKRPRPTLPSGSTILEWRISIASRSPTAGYPGSSTTSSNSAKVPFNGSIKQASQGFHQSPRCILYEEVTEGNSQGCLSTESQHRQLRLKPAELPSSTIPLFLHYLRQRLILLITGH